MINQQAYQENFMGGMNAMKKDKTRIEKANVKKNKNVDITQTKEFWSTLAVLS